MASDPDVPKGRKAFVPLDSANLAFHEVFSIEDPELLAFIPRPAHALLLIFPVTKTYEKHRVDEDTPLEDYQGHGEEEPVIWFKQTIRNACGMIGLLHAISNGASKDLVMAGSSLDQFLRSAVPLKPVDRAQLLYDNQAIEAAHASAAQTGDTAAPAAEDNIDLHFVCFVKGNDGHLWEMDGRRKGPLDRGILPEGEDVLGPQALARSVREFMQREDDLRFSLVALAPSFG